MSIKRTSAAAAAIPPKFTKAQREYLLRARRGVLALGNAAQSRMQTKLETEGLITRDHYGYFVLTDAGSEALGSAS